MHGNFDDRLWSWRVELGARPTDGLSKGVLRMGTGFKTGLLWWLVSTIAVGVCTGQLLNRSPAPMPQPIYPGAAKVTSVTGQVSVLRDSYPWALQVGDAVKPQQVIITGPDSFAVFQLSDGSSFHVFPNSRVTFRNNPGDWKDLLDLWIGRVKVFIQKFGDQPNRNRIFTPTAIISVRGTVFDVVVEGDDDTTLVSVEEGVVAVRHRLIGESKSRLVHAGEYIRVYKNEPIARQSIDKGALMQRILRASADAFYTIMLQHPRTSVPGGSPTGTGGGPRLPGDTGGTTPPPAGGGSAPPAPTAPPVPPPPPPPAN